MSTEYRIIRIDTTTSGGLTDTVRTDSSTTGVTLTLSGLTVSDNLIVNGNISGGTFYGNGQYLTGVSADNFYTTGVTINGNSLYFDRTDTLSAFTVDLTGLSNLPTDEEFQLFGNQSSTGIIYTDGLSVNGGDNTKFDLGLTQGWIIDNTTNPSNPTTQFVNFSASTAITVTNT
jgi:hypothetical protein